MDICYALEAVSDEKLEDLFELTYHEYYEIFLPVDLLNNIQASKTTPFELHRTGYFLLIILKYLSEHLHVPDFIDKHSIEEFCLQSATLLSCTASTSFKLHEMKTKIPVEMLVVDEAAQLKECESSITLQVLGIQHAIFFGDEYRFLLWLKARSV